MCVTPRTFQIRTKDGWYRPVELACRKCWQCRANRVSDWVGRATAENETSTASYFVTLTYGHTGRYGEPLAQRAKSLDYRDVQRWLKRIRNAGHNVRYIVAGEYGPKKGRTHWHAVLFFRGKLPDVKLGFKYWNSGPNTMDPFWQDGNTVWEEFHPQNAKYVCKYMLKPSDDERLAMARISRFPPLGDDYFKRLAEKYVENGLSPQDFEYKFESMGNARPYHLQGVSRENFLAHFIKKWREKHGGPTWPYSEIIEEYLHGKAEYEPLTEPVRFMKTEKPFEPPPVGFDLYVDAKLNVWACYNRARPEGAPLFWSFDEDGFPAWRAEIVTATEAKRRREAYASRLTPPELDVRSKGRR